MKTLIFSTILIALCGCDASTKNLDQKFSQRPEYLKDCTIDQLEAASGSEIILARCPNSTTSVTYKVGKETRTSITMDR